MRGAKQPARRSGYNRSIEGERNLGQQLDATPSRFP